MTWRQRLGRAARPLVQSVARAVRGETDEETLQQSPPGAPGASGPVQSLEARPSSPPIAAVTREEPEQSSLPAWGIDASEIPRRFELLPGPSSIELLARTRIIAGWAFSVYAVAASTAFLLANNHGPVAAGAIGVFILGCLALQLFGEPSANRTKKEHAAGYTVWRLGTLWKPQVDPKTGFVIRAIDEPGLSKKEEAEALARVRELARYLDDR